MDAINRAQRAEYLADQRVNDQYLTVDQATELGASLDKRFSFGESEPDKTSPYYDFGRWLKSSQQPELTLRQAIEQYGNAIHSERERIDGIVRESQPILLDRLTELASEGHLPAVLSERLAARGVDDVRNAVIDSFVMQKRFGPKFTAGGYYESGQDTTYLRPFKPTSKVVKDFVHEELHALSGMSAYRDEDKHSVSRVGLAPYNKPKSETEAKNLRHRILNEGATEYTTNIVIYGRPGEVSRDRRIGKDSGRYIVERQILQILADRIGLDVILNAWAEDYDPSQPNTTEHLRKFIGAVRQTYGPGFLRKLDKVDKEQGVERALDFMRAADYSASKKTKSGGLLGKIAARKQRVA